MRIKKILRQNRRDFMAIYICEGCGHEHKSDGYDDRNFHDNVIPSFECINCGESRNSLGIKGDYTPTKYGDMEVV